MKLKTFPESSLKISYDILKRSNFKMCYTLNQVFRDRVVPVIDNMYSNDEYFKKLFGEYTLLKLLNSKYFTLQEAANLIITCIIEHAYKERLYEINCFYVGSDCYEAPEITEKDAENIITSIRTYKTELKDIYYKEYFERTDIVASLATLTNSINSEKTESKGMRKLVERNFGIC